MVSKRRIFKFLARLYGTTQGVADFFDCSAASVERRMNSGTSISIEEHIRPLEDDTGAFPESTERFRGVLQAWNNRPDLADDVEVIHAALMRIKAKDPRQFAPAFEDEGSRTLAMLRL